MNGTGESVASSKPAVLIVDDELAICQLLAEILGEEGFSCETALNAAEALALLSKRRFDVALLDHRMPGMSGLDLLPELTRNYPEMKSIVVTAVNEPDAMAEALRRGASAYVLKPFSLDQIRNQVATLARDRDRAS